MAEIIRIINHNISLVEERGIMLCLETNTFCYNNRSAGTGVLEFDYVFNHIHSPNVGICLDTGHAHVMGSLKQFLELFNTKINYIHMHDNDGVHDMHIAPGQGSIDWGQTFRLLKNMPERIPIMLEYPEKLGYDNSILKIKEELYGSNING